MSIQYISDVLVSYLVCVVCVVCVCFSVFDVHALCCFHVLRVVCVLVHT